MILVWFVVVCGGLRCFNGPGTRGRDSGEGFPGNTISRNHRNLPKSPKSPLKSPKSPLKTLKSPLVVYIIAILYCCMLYTWYKCISAYKKEKF